MQQTKDKEAVFEFRVKASIGDLRFNVGFGPTKVELNNPRHIPTVSIHSNVVAMHMAGNKRKTKENPVVQLG